MLLKWMTLALGRDRQRVLLDGQNQIRQGGN